MQLDSILVRRQICVSFALMPGMILQVGLVWIIVACIQFADEYGSVKPDRRKRKSNLNIGDLFQITITRQTGANNF